MESGARRRRHLLAGADGAVRLRRLRRRAARLLPAGPAVARHPAGRPRHRAREHADRARLPAAARSLCGAADAGDRPGHLHLHHQRHRLLHQPALGLHAAVRRRARHHQVRRARLPRSLRHEILRRQLLPDAVHPAAGDRCSPSSSSAAPWGWRSRPCATIPAMRCRAASAASSTSSGCSRSRPSSPASPARSTPPTSAPSAPTSSRSRCCCSCCR